MLTCQAIGHAIIITKLIMMAYVPFGRTSRSQRGGREFESLHLPTEIKAGRKTGLLFWFSEQREYEDAVKLIDKTACLLLLPSFGALHL